MSHVVLDSIQEDMFICGCCKVIFKSLSVFLEHKESPCQREETVYTKNYLNYNSSAKVLANSTETCDNQGEICPVCMKKFTDNKSLLVHMRFHERSCQCPVCGRCFDNNSHVRRHIASHKVWPDGLNGTTPKTLDVDLMSYSCVYCSAVLANYSQYRAHLNTHIALKKFKCIQGDCIFFSENIEDLLCHISDSHIYTNYICHLCKINFGSLDDIALHQQNHCQGHGLRDPKATDTLHKCPQCDAVFKTPGKLSFHLLTENHNKACIHCSKAFSSDKRLRMHLQIHKKSKAYQCGLCGSSFNLKKYLTAHMLRHGERQFPCMICKSTFKRKDILRRHTKLHSVRKLHQCPFKEAYNCHREFTRRDKMKEHMKCHINNKNKTKTNNKKIEPAVLNSDTVEIHIVPLDRENLGVG